MNKGIHFNNISIFRQTAWGNLFNVGLFHVCSLLSSMERKSLLQEKEYNWAISYQIKNRIPLKIYKSAYSDNIA